MKLKEFLKKQEKRIYVVLGIFLVVLVWEIVSLSTNEKFFPEFFFTLGQSFLLLKEQVIYLSLGWTFLRLLIAFVVSAIIGVSFGTLAGYFPKMKYLLSPLMTVLRSIPTIALAMVFIVYVPSFSLYITSLVMIPLIYQASLEGSEKAYQKYENLLLLKGRKHISNITNVVFPLSLNYALLGFLQALGLGLKVEVMSETLAYKSNYYGIGKTITQAYNDADFIRLMALVLLVLMLSLILECLIGFTKRRLEQKVGLNNKKS